MTKGSDYDFIGLYTAMLKDIEVYFPIDRTEWTRDLSRITQLSSSRGLPVFTMDLPALGKALDASLAKGRLDLKGLNHSGSRFPGSKIPRLFWGLWSRLFDDFGCLKQDIDPNVVVFLRGLLYVGKNLQLECAPRYLYETVKEFYDVEEETTLPSHIWEGDGVDLHRSACGSLLDYHCGHDDLFHMSSKEDDGRSYHLLNCIQQVADAISGDIGFIQPELLRFRHGPGAVSDGTGREYKYDFPYWSRRLEPIFPYTSCGSTPLRWDGVDPTVGVDIEFTELASKLIAVPKTQKGPRLIAAEPTCHQWVQQGIRDLLYSYVEKRSSILNPCITFRDQGPSGELALSGSKSGRLATVDLKSASDRLSTGLVQRIFRANPALLGAMIASRTRYIVNKIDRAMPSLHKLRKFSTQGSALTFPIQSIVFATICIGVGKSLHPRIGMRVLARRVRVFGDDIIVPKAWEPQLRQVLHLFGLRVNDTKTFTEGNFRESCGVDAWCGYDVTPPHISCVVDKSNARSVASNVAVSNNFYLKGWWNAADWLQRQLATRYLRVVGPDSGIFGLTSRSGALIPQHSKWNKMLHRDEIPALAIMAKSRTVKKQTAGTLMEYLTKAQVPLVGTARRTNPNTGLVEAPCLQAETVTSDELFYEPNADTRMEFYIDHPLERGWLRRLYPSEIRTGVVQAGDPVIRVTWVPVYELE